jgi:outer membrane protein TolC
MKPNDLSQRLSARGTVRWTFLILVFAGALSRSAPLFAEEKGKALRLSDVLASVRGLYPPYLAALLEQDIANGRVRQAQGAFDLQLSAGAAVNPLGYYSGSSGYAGLEQPLNFWGGSVYGGYRLSSGLLPNYNKDRTGSDGEAVLGFRVPLLREGSVDRRRVNLWQSQIDRELADPLILRQYLDFIRAATIAYYNWTASGYRLALAEELLRLAKDRDEGIAEQVSSGASAPIVRIDNQRLVVSREIGLVQATRRFQAAAIELSLFYRQSGNSQPVIASRERLPEAFPPHPRPQQDRLNDDIRVALTGRPEMVRLRLSMDKIALDQRLAKNNLLPNLDLAFEARQTPGNDPAKDSDATELEAKLEFKLPLQRREAKGRLDVAAAQRDRLIQEQMFAQDRIAAEVRDSYSALITAHDALKQTRLNVELSQQLQEAENERVKQGAADLLALQLREQAMFEAKVLEVEAQAEYFRAQANYRAAVAADAPQRRKR